MSGIPQEALKQLKQFITVVKSNPQILHVPELSFFKEYLESLGATIPKTQAPPKEEHKHDAPKHEQPKHEAPKHEQPKHEAPKHEQPKHEPPKQETHKHEEKPEEMETDEAPEPEDTNLWAPDHVDEAALPFGDSNKSVSDDDIEAANDLLSEARSAAREGNFHEAILKLTEVIKRNPEQSTAYAFRAEYLVKEKKPNAAIRDADKALQLNPDSTRALKTRGKAKRHVGKYLEAFYDLSQGNSLDWDENTAELIKEISERAERAKVKQRKEEEKARIDQLKREAAEKRRRQQEEEDRAHQDFGDAGFGGGPGMEGLGNIFSQLNDPEIQAMFKNNPQLIQKVMKAVSGDPSVLSDPEVLKVISKLQASFGGGPGGPGGPGAPGGADPHAGHSHGHGGQPHTHTPPPQKPSSNNDDLD